MKVFISHSSVDRTIAEAFIELLRAALPLTPDDIRCTSVPGYKLEAGIAADEKLRREVYEAVIVIALLSPASIKSVYVLFELGARWGAKGYLAPVMVAGFDPTTLKAPLTTIHAASGVSESDLHELIETLAKRLNFRASPPAVYLKALGSFVKSAQPSSSA